MMDGAKRATPEVNDTTCIEVLTRYLESVIRPLVDRDVQYEIVIEPSWVEPTRTRLSWSVAVPSPAMRYVLGKEGATANAIRTLLRARSGGLAWRRQVMVDIHVREL